MVTQLLNIGQVGVSDFVQGEYTCYMLRIDFFVIEIANCHGGDRNKNDRCLTPWDRFCS